jgi:hypothetical protein
MWKLGLWQRYSFSGNICFEVSVLALCSAAIVGIKTTAEALKKIKNI